MGWNEIFKNIQFTQKAGNEKQRKEKEKTNCKMAYLNLTASIITLNVENQTLQLKEIIRMG